MPDEIELFWVNCRAATPTTMTISQKIPISEYFFILDDKLKQRVDRTVSSPRE
ncbi:MAG: hypothetical protein Q8O99_05350 [bacterium]|nr:hypothetical protein [bacterium]